MNAFLKDLKISLIFTLLFAIILGGLYPLGVWVGGIIFFPRQANGSLITDSQGQIIGSELIGQPFDAENYFHPRPSTAGNGYDAGNSGGSNLGPTSKKLADFIKQRVDDYRKENSLAYNAEVPADAVTASASGLDPEISLQNAQIQAVRVAEARKIELSRVRKLIDENTLQRNLGIFGEPGVNVLTLNIALDKNYPTQK